MNEHKQSLELELGQLILKYTKHLDAGLIAESVIGLMTTLCAIKANRTNETDFLYTDLCEIININIQKSKRKYHE